MNFLADAVGLLRALLTNNKDVVQLYVLCNPHNILTILCREYPYLVDPYCRFSTTEVKRRLAEHRYIDLYVEEIDRIPIGYDRCIDKMFEREFALNGNLFSKIKAKLSIYYDKIWNYYAAFRMRNYIKKEMGIPSGKLYDVLPDHLFPFPNALIGPNKYDDFQNRNEERNRSLR